MNLYFRLLLLFLKLLWKPKHTEALQPVTLTMRVMPNDLDIYLHVNNGRYLSLMDLGRFQLTVQTGLLKVTLEQKWAPLLGSVKVHFLRALTVFQQFTLSTQVIYWDEKWFYIEQKIIRNDTLYAVALMKLLFVRQDGTKVTPDEIASHLPHPPSRPAMPDTVKYWQAAESELRLR